MIISVQRRKINRTEMGFLRKIDGKTVIGRMRREMYRTNLNVQSITSTVEKGQLRRFGHIKSMNQNRSSRRIYVARPKERKGKGFSPPGI